MIKTSTTVKGALFFALTGMSALAHAQLLPLMPGPVYPDQKYYAEAYANYFPGSYYRTCRNTSFDPRSGIMRSHCRDRAQNYHYTHMYVSHRCSYIENINGQLSCTSFKAIPRMEPMPVITRNISAGPIWNNADATTKCPTVCHDHNGSWDGNWNTVATGDNSVCACKLAPRFARYYRHLS